MSAQTLDQQDRAILRLLQEDAGRPQREIAQRVNLSAPAVQRRIARLERERVIRQRVAVIDPAAVGFPITVLVEVTLTNDRSATVSEMKTFFRRRKYSSATASRDRRGSSLFCLSHPWRNMRSARRASSPTTRWSALTARSSCSTA